MKTRSRFVAALVAAAGILAGCHTDMWRQPKLVGQEGNEFFHDKMSTRAPVEGTVAVKGLRNDDAKFKGRVGGKLVDVLPAKLTLNGKAVDTKQNLEAVLRRGKERFDIFCSHCHGAIGDGKGMIAQRGLSLRKPPASYHTDRLRAMPLGYFFDVMTFGHGVMFPFNYRVKTDDRWAIAAYIRVLQRSQNVKPETMTPEQRAQLDQPADSPAKPTEGGTH